MRSCKSVSNVTCSTEVEKSKSIFITWENTLVTYNITLVMYIKTSSTISKREHFPDSIRLQSLQ